MSLEWGGSERSEKIGAKFDELIADLESEYGAEQVAEALGRIFGTHPVSFGDLPPVSNALLKGMESLRSVFGEEAVVAELRRIYERRLNK